MQFSVKRSPLQRYAIAVVATSVALLTKLLLDPVLVQDAPFLLLFGAILVSAWYGGLGPGLLTTVLAVVFTDYFFLYPRGSFSGLSLEALPLALFLLEGTLVCLLVEALRTARQRAEQKAIEAENHEEDLRRSEERLRSLVEGVRDYAILMLDPRGNIVSWNTGAQRISGYTAGEIIGRHFSILFTDDDVRLCKPERELEVAAAEGHYEEEGIRVRKDGSRYWADIVITALRDANGQLRGFSKVTRDTTERREAARQLQEAENRLRMLVEHVPAVTYTEEFGTDHDLLYISPQVQKILGYSPEEFVADPDFRATILHPEDRERVLGANKRASIDDEPFKIEYRLFARDGRVVWVRDEAVLVSDKEGNPRYWQGFIVDVTERKRAEDALQSSLAALLALYEAGQILSSSLKQEEIGAKLLDIMERVLSPSAAVINLRGEEERLQEWRAVGPESILAAIRHHSDVAAGRQTTLESEKPRVLELRLPDTEMERLVGLFVPLRVRDKSIGSLEAYGADSLADSRVVDTLVSLANQAASALENARLYEELTERERQLHKLVNRLLTVQEEERRSVAYDIHDGLAQTAAAAYHHLQAFARHYHCGSARDRQELDEALELVRTTVGEARRVISNLRPTVLDDFGLSTAIRQQISSLQAKGWQVKYTENLKDERLPAQVETALYRVAGEALTNVRKHAGDAPVNVTLEQRGNTVRLLVQDEGRGFSPEAEKGQPGPGEQIGLSAMEERISLLGGKFDAYSQPGAGTLVVAEVPLPQLKEDAARES